MSSVLRRGCWNRSFVPVALGLGSGQLNPFTLCYLGTSSCQELNRTQVVLERWERSYREARLSPSTGAASVSTGRLLSFLCSLLPRLISIAAEAYGKKLQA
jgi:hypothetical protein